MKRSNMMSALVSLAMAATMMAAAAAPPGKQPLARRALLQQATPAATTAASMATVTSAIEVASDGVLQKVQGQLQVALNAQKQGADAARIREIAGFAEGAFDGNGVVVEVSYVHQPTGRQVSASAAPVQAALAQAGGTILGRLGNAAVVAWVPLAQLELLAASPAVARIMPARKAKRLAGSVTSEGLTLSNADWWQAPGGFNGTGIKVAVIDGFDSTQVASLQASGDWPPAARLTTKDFKNGTCSGFGCAGEDHGMATLELAHDYVPQATFTAYDTWYVSDWYAALLDAANVGDGTNGPLGQPLGAPRANVVSVSLGAPLDAIGDGTTMPGSIAEAAGFARANGVVVVNAAGNAADSHWGGLVDPATSGANNRFHRWGTGNNGSTYNDVFDGYCIPGGFGIVLSLSWDDWKTNGSGAYVSNQDYALRLYRQTNTGYTQVAVSDFQQNGTPGNTPQEYLTYTTSGAGASSPGCSGGAKAYYARIERKTGTTSTNYLQFFDEISYGLLQRQTAPNSLGFPADSPNVITVGAMDFSTPTTIETFSGRGPVLGAGGGTPPSNPAIDANPKPDVVQFDFVSTVAYGATDFGGTSAATPQVAGMVAQILQHYGIPINATDVDDVKGIVHSIASTGANDLGTAGIDYTFGWGRLKFQKEAQLYFAQQPSNTYVNDVITPDVKVGVRDADGLLVRYGIFDSIALTIDNNPPGTGVLSQTSADISRDPVSGINGGGIATFDSASIDTAGVGYTLKAVAGTFDVTSNTFDILLQAVDGQCGAADGGAYSSAPTQDLCNAGTPTSVIPVSGAWTWTCQGIAGGVDDACSAAIQYTVTFVDWDASVLSTQNVNYGGAATAPANPTRTGYSFSGWDVPFNNITADLTVTAQYTINQYTVTFVDWDASVLSTQSVAYGSAATAPAAPTRTGYSFSGWDVPFNNITADLTVTAQYTINQYTVTFVDWDASVLSTQNVNYGGAAAAPANPTRTGYSFSGWDVPFNNITADLTVTAQYTINQYTVTFVDWDASVLSTQSVAYGSAATAPAAPTRTGYSFSGWDVPFNNITADLTVTAQYTINQYTVTFVDWDASVLDTQSVAYGSAATAPAAPTRTGYSFSGWDVPFNNITADLTVTAQYTINQYTVTFVDWDASVLDTQSVAYGSAATAPAAPTRTGYSFSGWDVPFNNITADLTVTAQYTINQYTVTFVDWDASVLSTQNVNYGGAATAPANPTRTGYSFSGWDVPFNNITADLTVTAQYTINQYTVTFVDWDASVLSTQNVNYGGAATAPANPTRTGYSFSGWDVPFNNITADLTVTAQYTINQYTITASSGGNGSITPPTQNVNHGGTASFTVTPDTGYHVVSVTGDTCSVTGSVPNYSAADIQADCAVTATFAIDSYTVTATAGANGAITPPTQSVDHGGTASFTVTPDTGYHVVSVTGDTCSVTGSVPNYSAANIQADCAVTATFAIDSYTVTATAGANGAITPPTQSVDHGGTASFTVTPDTGYHVLSVTGDTCSVAGSVPNYSAANIQADCAVTATFAIDTFTVTATSGGNGSITPPTQNVNHGGTASFTVTPDTGYHVDAVTGDTCTPTQGSGNDWSAANITADCAVTATFAIDTFTVTATSGGNGSITPPTQNVNHGGTASFTVTPDTGYHVVSVTGDTCSVTGSVPNYSAADIQADCAVSATFAIDTYTVTATSGGNGSITPPTQSVDHGGTASFTVTPDTGYHVVSVTGDTCSVTGSVPNYSAADIQADCAVTATFAIDTFTVTATSGGNGSITPPTQNVNHGGTASFTVTPDTGYHVDAVTGDTCTPTQGSGNDWSAANITADCAVTATFAIDTFTVTATSGGNGSITPPTQNVNHGGTASFTVTPDTGYHVDAVTGDTCTPTQGSGNDWSAANITADCAVSASFVQLTVLTIGKTVDRAEAETGDVLTWTVVVSNTGPDTADAELLDAMPNDVEGVQWTCVAANGASCGQGSGAGDIDFTSTLPVGGTITVSISATVSASAPIGQLLVNDAAVNWESEGQALSATDSASTFVVARCMIFCDGFENPPSPRPTEALAGEQGTLTAPGLAQGPTPAGKPTVAVEVLDDMGRALAWLDRLTVGDVQLVRLRQLDDHAMQRASAWVAWPLSGDVTYRWVQAPAGLWLEFRPSAVAGTASLRLFVQAGLLMPAQVRGY